MVDVKSQSSDERCVTGDLRNFNIFDITQSLMMSRKTALVTVTSGANRGFVFFKDGQIIHAIDDGMNVGEQAAFKIFYWRNGQFRIDFDAEVRERNVKLDTENLMLEIARHMDEAKRQGDIGGGGEVAAPGKEVETKFEDRFRNELHKVFKQVATQTSPSRDRYTVRAFDALLAALNDLSGSALFLKPDARPRVKTATGFETIKQDVISASEIDGFLNVLLSGREKERFAETKEITVYHSTPQAGTFQVSAFYDGGRPACIFTPASKTIPGLSKFGPDAVKCGALLAKKSGLILIAGPLSGQKSTFLSALLDECLKAHDALVTLFARHHIFAFTDECGFLIRSDLLRFSFSIDGGLEQALHQGSDVIAVDEIMNGEMLRDAAAVAAGRTLVLATLEASDPDEVADRLESLSRGGKNEKQFRPLAQSILGVCFVDIGNGGTSSVRLTEVTEDARASIAKGSASAWSFLRTAVPT